jgi:hypothetical protein
VTGSAGGPPPARRPGRRPVPVLLAVLLAGSLTACGGAPADADAQSFCEVATRLGDEEGEASPELAADLEAVGTPAGIPTQAREGFEIQVDLLAEADDGAPDASALGDGELDRLAQFGDYVDQTCT